jgi:hypothetical protein
MIVSGQCNLTKRKYFIQIFNYISLYFGRNYNQLLYQEHQLNKKNPMVFHRSQA